MIDENNSCITKSKLTITIKTFSKYNDRTGLQPNKQTNRLRDSETDKHLGKKHTKERKRHIYKYTHKQTYCGHTDRES